jgi:hypothetical protein
MEILAGNEPGTLPSRRAASGPVCGRLTAVRSTTATTRICLDVLRSAGARREDYVGAWLPEPVVDMKALAPDAQTELAEDLSIALLLALDRLSPLER